MNVLVIEPGHGSLWLDDAVYVDDDGRPDPDGEHVWGWDSYRDSGPNLPDGGINIREMLTYPRKWILKVEL